MCAQVLNYVAGGRDVAASVAFVCSNLLRGPGAPLVKRLAYDVVQVTLEMFLGSRRAGSLLPASIMLWPGLQQFWYVRLAHRWLQRRPH
jgi:hypothetical protein